MSVIGSNVLAGAAGAAGAAGYEIERSLRFNSDDTAYLSRTPSSAGNRTTWTWSAWIKRTKIGTSQRIFTGATSSADADWTAIHFVSDKLYISGYNTHYRISNRLFRDPGAWFHLVVKYELGASAEADKIKAWYNGEEITWATSSTAPSTSGINTANNHTLGAEQSPNNGGLNSYCDLYLAEVHFIDGQALAPTDFGELDDNNVWQPIEYSGTYGTNGFHLDFSDNSSNAALGTDSSGNSNTWTVNNFSVASGSGNDSLIDTPMNYTAASGNNGGNYCTLNPLDRQSTNGTLSNGNLDITQSSAAWAMYRSTMFVSSGKWYWELTIGNNQYTTIGICTDVYQMASSTGNWVNGSTEMFGYYPFNGKKYNGGTNAAYATADTTASGSVIGVALDMDNGTLAFYKDGTSLGTAYTGLTGKNVSPTHWLYQGSNPDSYNFGQRPFAISSVPTGFKSLCTTNLDDPLIADGSTAMDVLTYDGTNNAGHSVTGLSFAPDFIWIKCRSTGTTDHVLGNKINEGSHLASNTTDTETTGLIQSLDSTGFSLASNSGRTNQSGRTYVGWAWDAGTTTDTNNTDGSITPTGVRANASAGFSIVEWTGTSANGTIGHGLNAAPEFIITKIPSNVSNWHCYHRGLTDATKYIWLNSATAEATQTAAWNSTHPTSSVFYVGGEPELNRNGFESIAYCFAPVEGYSAFGSYTGNGSSDGPFVYTGFKTRWLMIKSSSNSGEDWLILDTARDTYNDGDSSALYASLSHADNSTSAITTDILSNGFKCIGTNAATNASGYTYIYAAFAEHPFKTARAR